MVQKAAQQDQRQQAAQQILLFGQADEAQQQAEEHELLIDVHHIQGPLGPDAAEDDIQHALHAVAREHLVEPDGAVARLVPLAAELFAEEAACKGRVGFEDEEAVGQHPSGVFGRGGGIMAAVFKGGDGIVLPIPPGGGMAVAEAHGHPGDHGDALAVLHAYAVLIELLRQLRNREHAGRGEKQTQQRAARRLFEQHHAPHDADRHADNQQIELERDTEGQERGTEKAAPEAALFDVPEEHPHRDRPAGKGRDIAVEIGRRQNRLEAEKEHQHQEPADARVLEQQARDGDEGVKFGEQPEEVHLL